MADPRPRRRRPARWRRCSGRRCPSCPASTSCPASRKTPAATSRTWRCAATASTVDRGHVAAYAAGLRLPAPRTSCRCTYPHMLAFPLHMAIMTDPAFPFPAIGMVHVENTDHPATAPIARRRGARRHGAAVERSAAARQGHASSTSSPTVTRRTARPVWESTLDLPAPRARATSDATPGHWPSSTPPPAASSWRLPGRPGPQVRRGVGRPQPDPPLPADRQGVRLPAPDRARHVDARPAASRRSRTGCPTRSRVEVAFKKPVFLPGHGRVRLARRTTTGWTFALTSPKDGAPHLWSARATRPSTWRSRTERHVGSVVADPDQALLGHRRDQLAVLGEHPRQARPRPPPANGENWS